MALDPVKKDSPTKKKYPDNEVQLAYDFAQKVWKEFNKLLKAVVLFGSRVSSTKVQKESDIDVLLVIDDVSFHLSKELLEKYRIIVEKTVLETSKRIHVTTMNFTSFWEYSRVGDPLAINILREGVAMIDTGFFYPMQMLLYQGRIRPTKESILAYYSRAPQAIANSKWHIVQATLDLYWAGIDAAHAALMTVGQIPPAPSEVAKMMEKHLVEEHKIPKKHVKTMDFLYHTSRRILHHTIKEVDGKDYDTYLHHTYEMVKDLKHFIKIHSKK